MHLLDLQNVSKHFANVEALAGVTFSVPRQSIFGLLGPNGAGKTTLIRIITNIVGPDSGEIRLNGRPLRAEERSRIGYMPEERGLYKKMYVGEQLLYLSRLKGLGDKEARARIVEWFERFDIADWRHKRIEDLSKGMQQKVQFISTVLHEPELLILDEPFSGLDPVNTNLIKEEINRLRNNGTTIIFSTHRMEQVEEICEDIVLINEGQLVLEGRIDKVKDRFKRQEFAVEYRGEAGQLDHHSFRIVERNERRLIVRISDGATGNDLLGMLINRGVEIVSFREILPTLNEIFIRLVQSGNPAEELRGMENEPAAVETRIAG